MATIHTSTSRATATRQPARAGVKRPSSRRGSAPWPPPLAAAGSSRRRRLRVPQASRRLPRGETADREGRRCRRRNGGGGCERLLLALRHRPKASDAPSAFGSFGDFGEIGGEAHLHQPQLHDLLRLLELVVPRRDRAAPPWDPASRAALRRDSPHAAAAACASFGSRLASAARAAGVAPLVGAFERWHFGWLLAAADSSESLDPLLPQCAAPAADAELAAELRAAGVEAAAAAALASPPPEGGRRRRRRRAARPGLFVGDGRTRRRQRRRGAPRRHRSAARGPRASIAAAFASASRALQLDVGERRPPSTRAKAAPATAMHAHCGDGAFFNADLLRLLLRYKHLGGSGFQASLGGGAHAALRAAFGVTPPELFASPLNARSVPFCSAFPDADAPFRARGGAGRAAYPSPPAPRLLRGEPAVRAAAHHRYGGARRAAHACRRRR